MRNRCALALAVLIFAVPSAVAQTSPKSPLPMAAANDNRTPAGEIKNNTLDLHLELREAVWYPEDESGGQREVYLFAEQGHAPQTPGPLIRVPQGTQIHASIRNTLPLAAKIYGLHRHPGDPKDAVSVAAGETRDVQFIAGEPGTYFYWATTGDHSLDLRDLAETLLDGAFIVDPPGAKSDDRIFVLGLWTKGAIGVGEEIAAVNGKSWPFAEHVTYSAGETIHWRVINPTDSPHGMHLHGFFFDVDAVGDGERYQRYAAEQRRKAVTEFIDVGHVFDMTWTPDRPGNWLFHCHMVVHMTPSDVLHPPATEPAAYSPEHEHGPAMGGLVIGITILPDANSKPAPVATNAAHKLQLVISENPAKIPQYKLEVKDPAAPSVPPPAAGSDAPPSLLGPPIVLTRGETTDIEVKNETTQVTTIHWHGMELESYYDGVAGWTGTSKQPSPSIAPGGSFIARMTPPRAGTFIYHTHWHDPGQLLNGIYGPLIVLEPGQKYDPEHDRTFVFSVGKYAPFGFLLLINGTPQPDPIELQTGTRYRLRLINITDDGVDLHVRLRTDDAPLQWKIIAKDGADLPAAQLKSSNADMIITVGETYDVEYQADSPGVANLQIWFVEFPTPVVVPMKFSAPK
jgi:FtsP/CotA-like multicopper oxidase with cupredoxin domain